MNVRGIIDRFEGDFVVIEVGRRTMDIPRSQVAAGAKVGDVVEMIDGTWVPNIEETKARKERITKLAADVWADD